MTKKYRNDKRQSVLEFRLYHHQVQSSWFQQPPHLISCSSLTFLALDLGSSCEGCYLLCLLQASIPAPLACTRQELPACSSGPENIWRTKIIAVCWRTPPWKVREMPELFLQNLKHHKWYLRPVSWGEQAKKYYRYGGRTCSSKCCTIPTLEQLPWGSWQVFFRAGAVLSNIYSPNLCCKTFFPPAVGCLIICWFSDKLFDLQANKQQVF